MIVIVDNCGNLYHSVRKCKDRLGININTKTFLTFSDERVPCNASLRFLLRIDKLYQVFDN